MKKILDLIAGELRPVFAECGYDESYAKVNLSNRPDLCEYQCNGAMAAAKAYRKKPIDIASDVVEKAAGDLAGMAGVSNPRLMPGMEKLLPEGDGSPWLELGYHIFRPYRNKGYGKEAAGEAASYAKEVLGARICAVIARENKASRRLAEGLGLSLIQETDTESFEGRLLYARIQP